MKDEQKLASSEQKIMKNNQKVKANQQATSKTFYFKCTIEKLFANNIHK